MFPVVSFAQEAKTAYLNYGDVFLAMPEYKLMIDSLQKRGQVFQNEMNAINEKYTKTYSDYIAAQDSLDEAIKIRRIQEIDNMRMNAESFQQYAEQTMKELEESLVIPLQAKVQKAIEDVGAESNFLYIVDSSVLRYTSPNATDATPLVKKKLGVQ
jgi:outer membrane protein